MRRRAPLFAAALASIITLAFPPRLARANEALGATLGRLVRQNYPALHACYRPLLARDRKRGGTVFVEIEAGRGGRVVAARAARDELQHAGLVACLATIMRRWSIPALERGAKAVLPLTFRGDPKQFAVRSLDVCPTSCEGRVSLLGQKNVGVRQARMSLLKIRRSLAVDEHLAELWVVLEGRGRVVSKSGWKAMLRAGDVVMPHVGRVRVEAERPLRILSVSPEGRAPKVARRPRRLGRWRGAKAFQHRSADRSLFVGVMALGRGQALSARAHLAEEALFYVLQGKGEVKVDGRRAVLEPGVAVGVAARRRYGLRATSRLRLLIVYAPAGPEARLGREGFLRR